MSDNKQATAILFAEWLALNGYKADYAKDNTIYWYKYVKASHNSCGTTADLFKLFTDLTK